MGCVKIGKARQGAVKKQDKYDRQSILKYSMFILSFRAALKMAKFDIYCEKEGLMFQTRLFFSKVLCQNKEIPR